MKKIIFFILKIALAGGILTYLIMRSDIKKDTFTEIPSWSLLLAGLCLLIQIFMSSLRWYSLMKAVKLGVTLRESVFLTMQGVFFTLFVPGGSVGGDLVKGAILAKRSADGEKFNGVFSILADRLVGLAGLLLSTLLASSVLWGKLDVLSDEIKTTLYVMTCICIGGIFAVAGVFLHDYLYRITIFRKMLELADKFTRGAFGRAVNAIGQYRVKWKTLVCWMLISAFFMFPVLAGSLYFCAAGVMKGDLSSVPFGTVICAANMANTAAAIPATPGGIGMRDLMSASILKTANISTADASLIPLVFTGVFLVVSLSGAVFFILDTGKKNKKT